ncbi:calcium-binding protein [Baekduia soli]|uniref:Calcium-binding protein n=1 Tax=Baekduia soli TaxID=496014 RepID=A0A5B8U975_9ACTN|nr:calcium-binding protein [Baekduia soli]QEC49338.1 calcium-binding protein [Baekduia soli]
MPPTIRCAGAGILALLATAALAGPAGAVTAAASSGVLVVTGGPGPDRVIVTVDRTGAPAFTVTDGFDAVLPGAGCSAAGLAASCPLAGLTALQVRLGDGDDSLVTQSPLPVDAAGEGGDDALLAQEPQAPDAPAPATLDGGEGDDRLSGSRAGDVLRGGPGDDVFDGNAGDDLLDLGPGSDTVSDVAGDDRIEAQDGTVDHVDCGPGTDTGFFDPVDEVRHCELGVLPPPAVPDCAPVVRRPTAVQLRRLRTTGALVVAASATLPCGLRARVLLGGRTVATATRPARATRVALRLGPRARRATRLTLSVSGSAVGAPTRTRRLTLRLPAPP